MMSVSALPLILKHSRETSYSSSTVIKNRYNFFFKLIRLFKMNECFIFTRPEFCFYSWWQYFETWKESQTQVAGSLSLKTALLYILTRPVTLGSEMKLPFTAKIFIHLLLKTALLEETQPNHLPTKKSVWHGLICLFVWISSTSVGYFVL